VREDGAELVPREYFRLLDAAGEVANLEAYFCATYYPATENTQSVETAWAAYLAGRTRIDVAVLEDPLAAEPERDTWSWHLWRELRRFRDGERRLAGADGPQATRRREQQLMRIGSAAWGAGLSLLMLGSESDAHSWLDRSALCYRRCLAEAEPGAWGRSIGAMKARLIADDPIGARREAEWTLDLGPEYADSTTATYAGAIALLTIGEDGPAASRATILANDPTFPRATAEACLALAGLDGDAYRRAVRAVLRTFEERRRFLEGVPVADTVLALQALAEPRGLRQALESPRLPSGTASV
jgi:hypothetical protein